MPNTRFYVGFYSIGGLICQGIVEYCDDHNVDTFIALSSPLMGQFGGMFIILYVILWFISFLFISSYNNLLLNKQLLLILLIKQLF